MAAYTVTATPKGYLVVLPKHMHMDYAPLPLAGGHDLRPGHPVVALHGSQPLSESVYPIHVQGEASLLYEGVFRPKAQEAYACFSLLSASGEFLPAPPDRRSVAYFGFLVDEQSRHFYFEPTPERRTWIETDICRLRWDIRQQPLPAEMQPLPPDDDEDDLEETPPERSKGALELAEEAIERAVEQARDYYNLREFPPPHIDWSLRGRAAGQAVTGSCYPTIRINVQHLTENLEDYLTQTIPHEVAHLVADHLYSQQNIKAHGEEWQKIMIECFGLEPRLYHNYKVTPIGLLYLYRCNCNEHLLGAAQHRRASGGARIRCRKCNYPLQFVPGRDTGKRDADE